MGIVNYYLFVITALLFIMTPGIDTMFVLNKTMGQGRKAGFYSLLGINSGILVHTIFAALGLSLIVAKYALAFAIVKYLGAAYLVYLGISTLRKGGQPVLAQTAIVAQRGFKNFYTGLVTNVLNPKVALFFLSFFPQFIAKERLGDPMPFLVLGATYCLMGIVWLGMLTFVAAAFSARLTGSPRFADRLQKISAAVYILMGVKIALSRR